MTNFFPSKKRLNMSFWIAIQHWSLICFPAAIFSEEGGVVENRKKKENFIHSCSFIVRERLFSERIVCQAMIFLICSFALILLDYIGHYVSLWYWLYLCYLICTLRVDHPHNFFHHTFISSHLPCLVNLAQNVDLALTLIHSHIFLDHNAI